MLDVNERTNHKKETIEMRFLRVVAGYRMTGHKLNTDVAEELSKMDINRIIETI
jgi:hypothetical protein